ncbi:MAG TPA: aminotransferase class I/II-fold pyridoxal phosphate-dependent enzyme [Nocardioidaceae bacterium]|nr:aminotransferase class I/II-fold pyridoxal phosphate-dependent enzyme [Nocardioidaceae bacterium]
MSAITVPLPVEDVAVLRRRRSAKWRTHPDDVLPLPVAEMDFALAPAVRDVLAEAVQRSDTGYASGADELAEALAGFAARRWGWRIDPDAVVMATDVGVACVELLRVLCRPGDGVVINPPVYPPFFHWVEESDTKLVEAPLRQDVHGAWRLDLDALADAFATRPSAYVLCNPHNPVGRVHSPDELTEVVRLAHQHGVTVISDEIHAPLALPGATYTPFLTVPGAADVGLSLVSASKAWNLAGLKCAAIVSASPAMRDVVARRPVDARWRVGHFGLLASVAAFESGGEWLDALLQTLGQRRDHLADLLAQRLPEVRWAPPEATYLAWLDCRAYGEGTVPRDRFLEHGRVALEPGPNFGAPGSGWVRLNFGTSAEILDEALARMASATQ